MKNDRQAIHARHLGGLQLLFLFISTRHDDMRNCCRQNDGTKRTQNGSSKLNNVSGSSLYVNVMRQRESSDVSVTFQTSACFVQP